MDTLLHDAQRLLHMQAPPLLGGACVAAGDGVAASASGGSTMTDMSSERDDTALISACCRGDEHAWQMLVERYGGLVYSVPIRLGLASADAEEVAQAVFISLFRRVHRIRDAKALPKWLLTTARRESWRLVRSRKSSISVDQIDPAAVDGPEFDLEMIERQRLVRSALERLGGRCQKLLQALFFSHSSGGYEKVASDLEMAVGSIGPERARCFAKLRPILRRVGLTAADEADSA